MSPNKPLTLPELVKEFERLDRSDTSHHCSLNAGAAHRHRQDQELEDLRNRVSALEKAHVQEVTALKARMAKLETILDMLVE